MTNESNTYGNDNILLKIDQLRRYFDNLFDDRNLGGAGTVCLNFYPKQDKSVITFMVTIDGSILTL
jgi:hypothetical protein